jgi:hypothetical protein
VRGVTPAAVGEVKKIATKRHINADRTTVKLEFTDGQTFGPIELRNPGQTEVTLKQTRPPGILL